MKLGYRVDSILYPQQRVRGRGTTCTGPDLTALCYNIFPKLLMTRYFYGWTTTLAIVMLYLRASRAGRVSCVERGKMDCAPGLTNPPIAFENTTSLHVEIEMITVVDPSHNVW